MLFVLGAAVAGSPKPAHASPSLGDEARAVWDDLLVDLRVGELGLRDAIHAAEQRMLVWAGRLAPAPDLAVLTTEPIVGGDSSGFGWRSDPINHSRRFHAGGDYRADYGTVVASAGDGVVTFAGWMGGYGRVVFVDHGGGVVTRYGHLQRITVKKDDAVLAGDPIGQVGSSGRATGPHLHFEVRLDGRAVDPVTAMTVADLERESPDLGKIAAFALSPDLQAKAIAYDDYGGARGHATATRPERRGRAKRQQVLW